MNNNNAPQLNTFLKRGFFIAVPGEHSLHYRPIQTQMSDHAYTSLADATQGGLNIDHAALRKIARDIVAPTRQSQGRVMINGGADSIRYAVFLEIEIRTPSHVYCEVISGYTDYAGISPQGFLDPNMSIMINSHARISTAETMGAHGRRTHSTVKNNEQVLRPVNVAGDGNFNAHATQAMRPADTLVGIQRASLGGSNVYDTRGGLSQAEQTYGVASGRDNSSPAHYLSTILRGYSQAHNSCDAMAGNERWITGTAASYVREDSLAANLLFTIFGERTSYGMTGVVGLGELLNLYPGAQERFQVTQIEQGGIQSNAQMFNSWGGATMETSIGHSLSHCIPAVMTKLRLVSAAFTLTNKTPDGSPSLALEYCQPMFDSENDVQLGNALHGVILHDIVPEVLDGRVGIFELRIRATLLGNMEMLIELDGNHPEPFSAPNYCDAAAAPVVATTQEHVAAEAANIATAIQATFSESNNPGAAAQGMY